MRKALVAILSVLLLCGCADVKDYSSDPYGVFDCIAETVNAHYCFFAEKDVDWDQVAMQYRSRIVPDITQEELFRLCCEMLNELRDGHVNLATPFDTGYYRKWWTDYPQDFDIRCLEQYYLNFDWMTATGVMYKILPENVGYMYYPSFSYRIGEGNLDYMLSMMQVCNGLIIDVRNNGGGEVTGISTFVGRFIHEPITGGYIRHKIGAGHDDFSEPYKIEYKPAAEGRVIWDKPIVVLCNRSTFSAANEFVSVMKQLGNVRIVGSRTGGGGGMPFTYEMPNGWMLRLSASPMTDADGVSIESGIDPSDGCEVHADAEALAQGRDAILDFAIELLK